MGVVEEEEVIEILGKTSEVVLVDSNKAQN